MRNRIVRVGLVASVVSACASASEPRLAPSAQDGDLSITLDKARYTIEEARAVGVRGTVRNTSDHTVYSKVGDAMILGSDQQLLIFGDGSDGALERRASSDTWTHVPTLFSVEGSSFVELRPGETYHFVSQLAGTPSAGTHRAALTYRTTVNDETQGPIFTAHSAAFAID
jgi:hypothetical protein